MRLVFAAILILVAAAPATPTRADPYRWCAVYGGAGGTITNCYFITIEQCRASASGNGGYCVANNFYDGRPVVTPEDGVVRGRARRRR